ncbi:hypothetical protein LCGC14_1717410 [marine sediment metagenome]|uniref:Uncharacterized protein n=1 Tax=marine sediment metagenome TaxID=412755 RepID=A0A0F9JTU5_9ZZZZ
MTECIWCKGKAVCRDKKVLKSGKSERYLYYCEFHKKQGIIWGWLDEMDLEDINGN